MSLFFLSFNQYKRKQMLAGNFPKGEGWLRVIRQTVTTKQGTQKKQTQTATFFKHN